ncbi:hypothetical protein BJ875DRAFT_444581 [Amylocarpus encephaloides]|uniref:Uncharacterized protein n=1 Tax=Amylocarpus encephaloides TaxID=45428 RepID=A0A9P8C215_9HELO|nr:hypothetical protein BJ875DRAFT_444581 [Amylocarpus encephaloides]
MLETEKLGGRESPEQSHNIATGRLLGLMQGLQTVAFLQEQLSNTQIDFRQKRREAAFKRDIVSDCDARFMKHLQGLIACGGHEEFKTDFELLQKLAAACQAARDELGPTEQEGIEAEQRWEGQIWSLRKAENHVYDEFEFEFQTAAMYPPPTESMNSSQYESASEPPDDISQKNPTETGLAIVTELVESEDVGIGYLHGRFDKGAFVANCKTEAQESTLLGLIDDSECEEERLALATGAISKSDSSIENIDLPDETGKTKTRRERLSKATDEPVGITLSSNLLTSFKSKRDRINKWLEIPILESRLEATVMFTILRDKLGMENRDMPSNWSQLVIAYWEKEEADSSEHAPSLSSMLGGVYPSVDLDERES